MEIEIIKEGPDPRDGRNKTLKKGRLTCTKEMGDILIKSKMGKEYTPAVQAKTILNSVKEAEEYKEQN
jgi:hypothetical protein